MFPRIAVASTILLLTTAAPASTAPPWRPCLEAQAELHHDLPAGLMAAVRRYERSGERSVGTGRGKDGKGGVCGPYQLLSRDWESPDGWALCRGAMGPEGVWREAALLARSRAKCRRKGGCLCPWDHHNWGDRRRLCAALGGGES